MSRLRLGIYGAGGFGSEVMAMVKDPLWSPGLDFVGFIDDYKTAFPKADFDSIDVLAIAIAAPAVRRRIASDVAKRDVAFAPIVYPNVYVRETVNLGIGAIICPGVQLTTNIQIGDFVILNLNATVGHDVQIGNFVSIMPGVNISGNVRIEDDAFIGSGATILNGVRVGKGAIIGSGAVVIRDVEAYTTVIGVPAKPMKR